MQRVHKLSSFVGRPSEMIAKDILRAGLFSIEPISSHVNKRALSMLYSPGVGAACMKIDKELSQVDILTLRARSVAIVSDGSMLRTQGRKFMPVMDWMIAQLKFYAGLDSFPFVIRPTANLETILSDLSTCYGTVLYLDNKLNSKAKIPSELLTVKQQDICEIGKREKTDGELTANVLSGLIRNKTKGLASKQQIQKKLDFNPAILQKPKSYPFPIHKGELDEEAIKVHEYFEGKIEIRLNMTNIPAIKPYFTEEVLTKIVQQGETKTTSGQMSGIVTDGTAVLGFGDIGPQAGLPVMEGKSLLFKVLGDVDVVPVCINKRKSPKESVEAILDLMANLEAINLEDIKAPECFDIEQEIEKKKLLPIFHDDQHGTAIVTLAAYINACKLANRSPESMKIVVNGAGAAGLTIARLLMSYGAKNIIICDSTGTIYEGRTKNMNKSKHELAKVTNREQIKGSLEDAMNGCDVFVGVSVKDSFKKEWIKKMGEKPIIFAMANPDPEITYEEAMENGCFIYGSGRSDKINQINNSLAFPGIFKGIHDHGLKEITEEMKIKAGEMIAKMAEPDLRPDFIMPDSLNRDVAIQISNGIGWLK